MYNSIYIIFYQNVNLHNSIIIASKINKLSSGFTTFFSICSKTTKIIGINSLIF